MFDDFNAVHEIERFLMEQFENVTIRIYDFESPFGTAFFCDSDTFFRHIHTDYAVSALRKL